MQKGFSLIEVLLAMSITVVLGTILFQLLNQNEQVFRDQNLVSEMHQGARAAISQAADEIRMAGQGVPVYAATFDPSPREETIAILSGSNATRLNFRAGLSPTESAVISPVPLNLNIGTPVTLTVANVSDLYNAVGGSPTSRFVYIWGRPDDSRWVWMRGSIQSVTNSTRTVRVTPVDSGAGGTIRYPLPPTLSLEEAIAIYFDSSSKSMRRTTAVNMTNPLNPGWSPANELAANVTLLNFTYFDMSGNSIDANGLANIANRARVARIDIRLDVQTAEALSNHTRPTFSLSRRSVIRSAAIH